MAGNSRPGGIGPLDPIYDVETAYGAIATGNSPGIASLRVTINKGSTQVEPAHFSPIVFDVVFTEATLDFATGDVTLSGTAGGSLVGTVIDSGDHINFTVEVTGMTTPGTVIANIASGVCHASSSGIANRPSTSTDNVVDWDPLAPPPSTIHWWDFSNAGSVHGAISGVDDLIGSADFTTTAGTVSPITSLGSNGLTAARCQPTGAALDRMTATGLTTTAQPFAISWVGRMPGSGYWFFFQTPLVYGPGTTWTSQAGVLFDIGTRDSAAHVFYVEYNGASTKAYVDGVLTFSGNGGAGSFAPFDPSTLFNQPGGGQVASSPMDIGELLVVQTPAVGDVAAEYTRLSSKWGV